MSEPNLYAFLIGRPALAMLVADRVYVGHVPQHDSRGVTRMPCIVVNLVAETRQQSHCGDDGLVERTVQLDVYATTWDDKVAVARALRDELRDFRGLMGDTFVKLTRLDTQTDLTEPDPGLERRLQQWTLWFPE